MMSTAASQELSLEDVKCPICLETMILPITLPCEHRLCKECFEQNFEKTSTQCVLCKKRYGTWYRQRGKIENCVDHILWAKIQAKFPEIVEASFTGVKLDEDAAENNLNFKFNHDISETGQIGKEWAKEREKLENEEKLKKEKEQRGTEALLLQLKKQELGNGEDITEQNVSDEIFMEQQKEIEEKIKKSKADEEIAKQIQDEWVLSTPLSAEEEKLKSQENQDKEYAKKLQMEQLNVDVQATYSELQTETSAVNLREAYNILQKQAEEKRLQALADAKLARKYEREEQDMERYYGTSRKPTKFKGKHPKGVK